jgi:U3 small nucleolar RNA-associated protein MPP10
LCVASPCLVDLIAQETLLVPTSQHIALLRQATKQLHDYSKATEQARLGSLRALVVDGFDAEAVWAQLLLRAAPARAYFEKHTQRILEADAAENTQLIKALLVAPKAKQPKQQKKKKQRQRADEEDEEEEDDGADEGELDSDEEAALRAELEAELAEELAEDEEDDEEDDGDAEQEDEDEEEVEEAPRRPSGKKAAAAPAVAKTSKPSAAGKSAKSKRAKTHEEDSEDESSSAFFAKAGIRADSDDDDDDDEYDDGGARVTSDRFFSAARFKKMTDELEDMDGLDLDVDLNSADAGDEEGADDEEEEEEEAEAEPMVAKGKKIKLSSAAAAAAVSKSKRRKLNASGDSEAAADAAAARAKYSDFFDEAPASDAEEEEEEIEELEPVDGEGEDGEAAAGGQDEAEEVGERSEYEKYLERMRGEIDELEAAAVAPRPWHLQGESSGRQRPESALLETHVEFETAGKIAPPITEETTAELETLIKRRCRDQAFDDVVRKVDIKSRGAFKAPLELNGERSALGLADIYAQEYMALSEAAAADSSSSTAPTVMSAHDRAEAAKATPLPKEHAEISALFSELCFKLDALSNFHFTPRPASLELRVQPLGVAALALEEVLPMGVSDAAARAPQEVYRARAGGAVGETELAANERAAARRAKKSKHAGKQERAAAEARTVERLNPLSADAQLYTNAKKLAERAPAKMQAGKQLKLAAATDETKYTRSHVLFSKLDDERRVRGADNGAKLKRGDHQAAAAAAAATGPAKSSTYKL